VLIFTVPILLLIVVLGIQRVFENLSSAGSIEVVLGAAVLGMIVFQPVRNGLARGLNPRELEEMRPITQRLAENYKPGDVVAVYYAAQYAYRYYSYLMGSDLPAPVIIRPHGDEPQKYLQEVDRLRGSHRVWVVFSHKMAGDQGPEEPIILEYLDEIGRQQVKFEETGASLYLYDLASEPGRPNDER